MCVCVCAFCCILQGAANRANKLRTAVDLISNREQDARRVLDLLAKILHVFLLRKCCYIIYNHDRAQGIEVLNLDREIFNIINTILHWQA